MKEQETSLPWEGEPSPNQFQMIDVGKKAPTDRMAEAQGRITVGDEAFSLIAEKKLPKGDALAMAEVAGIMAAKRTPDLLPLCHPLPLDSVSLFFELEPETASILVRCQASAHAKTGVEMEALTGVQGALLSIYDLTKMVEPALKISDVRLNFKKGGKLGEWYHPETGRELKKQTQPSLLGVASGVLTISDRCSQGEAKDESGPLLAEYLAGQGAQVNHQAIVPDSNSAILETLLSWQQSATLPLILTTGGSGPGPRDVTVETLKKIADKELPGIGELLRKASAQFTEKAWLSNMAAFVVKGTVVIALPGSRKAVKECLGILHSILPHTLHVAAGGKHG